MTNVDPQYTTERWNEDSARWQGIYTDLHNFNGAGGAAFVAVTAKFGIFLGWLMVWKMVRFEKANFGRIVTRSLRMIWRLYTALVLAPVVLALGFVVVYFSYAASGG